MADEPETVSDVAEACRELIQTRGWQLLTAQADEQYGPAGYGREMQRALASVPAGPDRPYELARVAEQVDSTARAVHGLMQWPHEQIKKFAPAKKLGLFAELRRTHR